MVRLRVAFFIFIYLFVAVAAGITQALEIAADIVACSEKKDVSAVGIESCNYLHFSHAKKIDPELWITPHPNCTVLLQTLSVSLFCRRVNTAHQLFNQRLPVRSPPSI